MRATGREDFRRCARAQAAFDPNLTPNRKRSGSIAQERRQGPEPADFPFRGQSPIEMPPVLRNVRFHPKSDRRSDSADIVKRPAARPTGTSTLRRIAASLTEKLRGRIDEIRAGPHRKGHSPLSIAWPPSKRQSFPSRRTRFYWHHLL